MRLLTRLLTALLITLSISTVTADEKDRLIESQKLELKKAKRKINELEEKLFVATEGKSVDTEDAEIGQGGDTWVLNGQRLPIGVLFPHPGTIRKGEVFTRFGHVGQDQTFTEESDPTDDFLGLESNVKIGVMLGYGLADGWDITLQRTNGRNDVELQNGDIVSYDLWDLMMKVKLMDENHSGLDAALLFGCTYFMQDNDKGEVAGNAGFLIEKSLGRLRVGTGVLYTSISTFESTYSNQDGVAPTKLYPNEVYYGDPTLQGTGNNYTTAVPVSLDLAVTANCSFFGEVAFPVSGYETDNGPSAAAGYRVNTNSHSYNLYFANTSNNSFNSTFTGGYKKDRLDVFGFSIAIFF